MKIMSFELVLICIIILSIVITINNELYKKYKINLKRVENEKIKLYAQLDPEAMIKEIDKFIDIHMEKYIMENILTVRVDYIKSDDSDQMVKNLTKIVYINLSDLYKFYISTITCIKNDDDYLLYIHEKVKYKVLDFVIEFNKSK